MAWRYVEYIYPVTYFFEKLIVWASAGSLPEHTYRAYFALKESEGDEWSFYSGDSVTHLLDTGMLLVSKEDEVTAQTDYLDVDQGKFLAVLPHVFSAQYVRLYIDDEYNNPVLLHEFRPSTAFLADEIISGAMEINDAFSIPPMLRIVVGGIENSRFGNLAGFDEYDSETDIYGLAMGVHVIEEPNTQLFRYDPVNGLSVIGHIAATSGEVRGLFSVILGGSIEVLDGGNIILKNESNENPAMLVFSDEYGEKNFELYPYYENEYSFLRLYMRNLLTDAYMGGFEFSYRSKANLASMFTVRGEASVIELIDESYSPDKYWYIVNHNGSFDIREHNTDNSNTWIRFYSEFGEENKVFSRANFIGRDDNTYDLGSLFRSFQDAYINNLSSPTGSIFINTDIVVEGNITANGMTLPDSSWGNYEEGEWTDPYIEFGGATTGQTYSTRSGHYTISGNMCRIQGSFIMTNKGTAAGNARIVGLPVVSNDSADLTTPVALDVHNINTGVAGTIQGYIYPDSDEIVLEVIGSSGSLTVIDDTHFTNTSEVFVEATYQIAGYIPAVKPVVVTQAATYVDTTSVTLNAELTDMGDETSVDVYFAYCDVESIGDWILTDPQTLTGVDTFEEALTGLEEDKIYQYRAVVEYGEGLLVYGEVLEFDLHTFKCKIDTTKAGSASDTIQLPISGANLFIDWGDSNVENIETADWETTTNHTYASGGEYNIKISGMTLMCFDDDGDKLKLIEITDGGRTLWTSGENIFEGCSNLVSIPANLFKYGTGLTSFASAFEDCSSLLEIPSRLFDYNTRLSDWAFDCTFYSCTSLTSIPANLFSKNRLVSDGAFWFTFSDCTSLTSIPADLFKYNTLVGDYGFAGVFWGCTPITSIPAGLFDYNTNVGIEAFEETFAYCTNLVYIPPDLFKYNINVYDFGFYNTFYNCTSITSIPSGLFDYVFKSENVVDVDYGFYYTFSSCSSLTSIPSGLFDYCVALVDWAFSYTFAYCSALTSIPSGLFDYNVNAGRYAFSGVFNSCTNLASIPSGLFDYNVNVSDWAFNYAFIDCESLVTIPDELFSSASGVNSFEGTFSECTGLISIPSGLFKNCSGVGEYGFTWTFSSCTGLTSIPSDLFNDCINVDNFSRTFQSCTGLTSIPSGLFDYNVAVFTFFYTFEGCTSLTSIPSDLFKYNVNVDRFVATFSYCSALTSIPSGLFDYNVAVDSFDNTFSQCTGLTSIPTDLFKYNVNVTEFDMVFKNCHNLETVPELLFKYNTSCLNWYGCFMDCEKLQLNAKIFYDTGEQSTRFAGQTVQFYSCFELNDTFTGTQGTAPDLWNCTGTFTKTYCFQNHSVTSLSNYGDIPSDWK